MSGRMFLLGNRQRFKLRKAAELLKTKNRKLDHICEEIGYKDTRQFIRSFKEMYGITPDKFQKGMFFKMSVIQTFLQ